MALTRKYLTALGIESEKIDEIISAHTETVDGLKEQLRQFEADAKKLPEVQAELDKAKDAAKNSGDYEKLKKEYDDYKAEVKEKETLAAKKAVLSAIAKDAGLSEAGIAKALKYSDYSKIELDGEGKAKDSKTILDGLKTEWSDYIETTETEGAKPATPPAGQPAKDYDSMSDADYYKATYEASKKGT